LSYTALGLLVFVFINYSGILYHDRSFFQSLLLNFHCSHFSKLLCQFKQPRFNTLITGFWFPAADEIAASTSGTERLRITSAGNLGLGTSTFGTSAATAFAIATGTAPTTGPADTIQIYSTDLSAGNTMLSLYTEGTVVNTNIVAATTHRIAIRVNGTVYYLLANTAP
jgi:hypothetical protein